MDMGDDVRIKKIFEIEYPAYLGSEWLNRENLGACLFSDTHIGSINIEITEFSGAMKQEGIMDQCVWNVYNRHGDTIQEIKDTLYGVEDKINTLLEAK